MSAERHPTEDEYAAEVWEDESPAAALQDVETGDESDIEEFRTREGWRAERDSLGEIAVPANRYWGAQTQRSLEHFAIGTERMPLRLIHAYGQVKLAAVMANHELGVINDAISEAITEASNDVASGMLDEHFPLSVFQTGSGTHTNANVNEVIANRGSALMGAPTGERSLIHPNDHVNASQSTNDTFITAMHVAAVTALHEMTLPSLAGLIDELRSRSEQWKDVEKVGRTHLMDATSISMGQEWGGYAASLEASRRHLISSLHDLYDVALGGTAVGTGVNTPDGFGDLATKRLAEITGYPFRRAADPFSAQSTVDAMVRSHAALKAVAVTLFKIANDVRWMASGPHHGLHELVIPELEPGSTIMPGKVNPTQAEATMMACVQVIGQDAIVSMAGAEGNFELNAFRPIVISNYLRSARLLADAAWSFGHLLIHELELDQTTLEREHDLDDVTELTKLAKKIGYDEAARLARDLRK